VSIKLTKYGKIGAIFLIVGLALFAFLFPLSLANETHQRIVGYFSEGELYAYLEPSMKPLYIVADIESMTRRDTVENISITIKANSGITTSEVLKNRRSTSNGKGISSFRKKIVLGYFDVDEEGKSLLTLENIEKTQGVKNITLSLHHNSNWKLEGVIVIFAVVSFISGIFLILSDSLYQVGKKLLNR
jgi:hypothetical protein